MSLVVGSESFRWGDLCGCAIRKGICRRQQVLSGAGMREDQRFPGWHAARNPGHLEGVPRVTLTRLRGGLCSLLFGNGH